MTRRPTAWLADTFQPAKLNVPDDAIPYGLHLAELVIEPRRGREVVLWIVNEAEALAPGVAVTPFRLTPRPFLLGTRPGPLLELLWTLADPAEPDDDWPLWSFRSTIDVHAPDGFAAYAELGEQSHLHVVLTLPNGQVLRWVELDNPFELGLIEPYLERARALPAEDFSAAMDEAIIAFDREDLIELDRARAPDSIDVVEPTGEGRIISTTRRALVIGADDYIEEIGKHVRDEFGIEALVRLYARFIGRCPESDTERLARLWGIDGLMV